MIHQQTLEKLRGLRLTAMADALTTQFSHPEVQNLSFEERLGLLVDQQWAFRDNRRLARQLKEAKLRVQACTEDIDYQHPRSLDRAVMRNLASCDWIRGHQGVIITGPTGVGKTFVSCALANAACRQGFSTRYYRVPRLLSELAIAKGDGSFSKILGQIARTQLLVLDDWALAPMTAPEARDLLEVIDDRYQARATIIATQLPVDQWHAIIADPQVADAILDRLVHNAHKLILKGESMRKSRRD